MTSSLLMEIENFNAFHAFLQCKTILYFIVSICFCQVKLSAFYYFSDAFVVHECIEILVQNKH